MGNLLCVTLKTMNKKCYKCGCELDTSKFHKDKTSLDGLGNRCKNCTTLRDKGHSKRFRNYVNGAKSRGYEFDLSKEEFMKFWNSTCYYCGSEIDGIGLDRVDNNIGYNIRNVIPCCFTCNKMKGCMDINNFIDRCRVIISNIDS